MRLLKDGERAFPEMLEAIASAQTQVWIEMYWFAADTIGRQFFAELSLAVERGVDVRVLYDSFGSLGTDSRFFTALAAAGAKVLEFNPVSPLQQRFGIQSLVKRNHRKLVICDGVAFVGGLNIADEWLPVALGGQGWRDDVVRVVGPVVAQLEQTFATSWREGGGVPLPEPGPERPPQGRARAAVLQEAHFGQRRRALWAYRIRLRQAKDEVLIANAYFVPNRTLLRGLMGAAKRGVDVRIMLPEKSDVGVVRIAGRAAWGKLLRAGVRIYLWKPSILHSKTAVVDRHWVTLGSYNLDYLSMLTNAELNVSVLDADFARVMAESFFADLERCDQVTWSQFRNRPMLERVVERTLYSFRSWL